MDAASGWLLEVVLCPEDGGTLDQAAEGARCATCGRTFVLRDGVLSLLPDRLAHLADPVPPSSDDAEARWIEDEMQWWNPWWERTSLAPHSPRSGLRGRSRERHLLRHVRDRVGPRPLVIEMGAGSSRTMAGLWPPAGGMRYVASDTSRPALEAGRRILGPGAASVQCDAVGWPMREGVADVVVVLGVLHHLSDWRAALARACRTVRPGGYLLMHEAVTKPRVLGRLRQAGIDDQWISPHEGDVPEALLRAELERRGRVLRRRGELSPLRFGIERFVISRHGLDDRVESSAALTIVLDVLDQAWGRTLGRLFPSLGFNEVTLVWQRPVAQRSSVTSEAGRLQQTSTFPSAGGSSGSGP